MKVIAENLTIKTKYAGLLKEVGEPVVISEPNYHYEAMGCGLEDRNITNRYEAMKHGWDCAIFRMLEQIPEGDLYTSDQLASAILKATKPLEEEVERLKVDRAKKQKESVTIFDANCELRAQLAAVQEECEFQRNAHKQAEELMLEQGNQLAAEQLNNKLLRNALNQWIDIASNCSIESGCCGCGESIENHSNPMMCGHSPVDMADSVVRGAIDSTDKALSLPASTEALDAYVAEKVKEAGKFDMWRTNPYTKVLETSIKQLTRQRDLAVEWLERCAVHVRPTATIFYEEIIEALSAIKEIEAMAQGEKKGV